LYGYSGASGCQLAVNTGIPTLTQLGSQFLVNGANSFNQYSLGNYMGIAGGNFFTTFPQQLKLPYGLGMNPVNGMIIKCNLTSNDVCNQTDNIDVIPLLSNFGSNNLYIGNPFSVIKLKKGRYSSITFTLCDQNGNQITLLDENLTMSFILLKSGFKNFSK